MATTRAGAVASLALANELNAVAAVGIARGMGEAMLAAGGQINLTQRFVARVLADKKLTAAERRAVHEAAAQAAQRSLIQGYVNRRRRRNTPPYRTSANRPQNVRLAGGILLRALRNPAMVDVNADSIRFINTQLLDREAAHWRRINFGALFEFSPPGNAFINARNSS